jgi:hypothetical protein
MLLDDLLRTVDQLSEDELEILYFHVRQQREHRLHREEGSETADRHVSPLDMDALMSIVDDLREGFSEKDLDELEWAMNVEYIEPLHTKTGNALTDFVNNHMKSKPEDWEALEDAL